MHHEKEIEERVENTLHPEKGKKQMKNKEENEVV